jgi:hypothetical protein
MQVKTLDTLKLVVDILSCKEPKLQCHMLIQGAVRLLYVACPDPSSVIMPLLATSARALLAMPLSPLSEEHANLAAASIAGTTKMPSAWGLATPAHSQRSSIVHTPPPSTQPTASVLDELNAPLTSALPSAIAGPQTHAESPAHRKFHSNHEEARESTNGEVSPEVLAGSTAPVARTQLATCGESTQPQSHEPCQQVPLTQPQAMPTQVHQSQVAAESLANADARLAAFFQLLGMVAIEHLCLLEKIVGRTRKQVAASNTGSGNNGKGSDDVGLAGVTGGVTADVDDFDVCCSSLHPLHIHDAMLPCFHCLCCKHRFDRHASAQDSTEEHAVSVWMIQLQA